jgi:hypothetical protein
MEAKRFVRYQPDDMDLAAEEAAEAARLSSLLPQLQDAAQREGGRGRRGGKAADDEEVRMRMCFGGSGLCKWGPVLALVVSPGEVCTDFKERCCNRHSLCMERRLQLRWSVWTGSQCKGQLLGASQREGGRRGGIAVEDDGVQTM